VFEKLKRGISNTEQKIAPNGNQDVWYYESLGRRLVDKLEQ